MTTIDKIILTIALATVFTIFVIGADKAYGQFEEVPFDYQNSGCVLVENTIDYKRYECYADWRSEDYKEEGEEYSPSEDGCPPGEDIDIRTGECRPHEIIEAEAIAECEADTSCPRGLYIPPKEPTKWEKIGESINPDTESATDLELIKKINQMLGAQCYQGIGTTAGSQESRSFDIPTIKIMVNGVERTVLDTQTSSKSLNLKGILGIIERAVRECVAQEVLLNPQGGVMSIVDSNFAACDVMPNDTVEFNPFCGKNYSDHSIVAQNVPIWSQQRVNEESNRGIDHHVWNILEDVCQGYYERSYQMIFEECRTYFAEQGEDYGTYAKKQKMKYFDDSAYLTFKQGNEDEQLEKVTRQNLEDKMDTLRALINALGR